MLLAAGCVPQPASSPSPPAQINETEALPEPQSSSGISAAPQDAPGLTPVPSASIPSNCEEILPAEVVEGYHPNLRFTSTGEEAKARLGSLLGPATVSALSGGEGQVYCGWGISNSDAIAYLGATIISDETRAALLSALRDSVYTELADPEAELVFAQGQSSEHRYTDRIVMDGNLLLAVSHTISGGFAQDAFTRIQG